MKKISILCVAFMLAAVSLTSCQKDENGNNQKFFATFEQAGKCMLGDNLIMRWNDNSDSNYFYIFPVSNIDLMTTYAPTSISADGRSAVLEYVALWSSSPSPFPAGQQGPFIAFINANEEYAEMNSDGSLHLQYIDADWSEEDEYPACIMPMVARANDFGSMQFKHLYGVLNFNVTLPEGYELYEIDITCGDDVDPFALESCDVSWNTSGDITLSNIVHYEEEMGDNEVHLRRAVKTAHNWFLPLPPGSYSTLEFYVVALDSEGNGYIAEKHIAEGRSITIERAGISNLTFSIDEDDMWNYGPWPPEDYKK